jgi:hypothetical protein
MIKLTILVVPNATVFFIPIQEIILHNSFVMMLDIMLDTDFCSVLTSNFFNFIT